MITLSVLAGVGDATLGQWEEGGGERPIYHVRRRLSAEEALEVGEVMDIRKMEEAMVRLQKVSAENPRIPVELLLQEIS